VQDGTWRKLCDAPAQVTVGDTQYDLGPVAERTKLLHDGTAAHSGGVGIEAYRPNRRRRSPFATTDTLESAATGAARERPSTPPRDAWRKRLLMAQSGCARTLGSDARVSSVARIWWTPLWRSLIAQRNADNGSSVVPACLAASPMESRLAAFSQLQPAAVRILEHRAAKGRRSKLLIAVRPAMLGFAQCDDAEQPLRIDMLDGEIAAGQVLDQGLRVGAATARPRERDDQRRSPPDVFRSTSPERSRGRIVARFPDPPEVRQ
jgi:hypothetical protein